MMTFFIIAIPSLLVAYAFYDVFILKNTGSLHGHEDKVVKLLQQQRLEHYYNNPIVKEIKKLQ